MHNYSVDNDTQVTIMWILTITSALINALINIYILPKLEFAATNIVYQILSLIIFYILSFETIFNIFDKYLWKLPVINNYINYPNISGEWKGTINNPKYNPISTKVEIKQTWTKIIMNLKTETAKSKTEALAFFVEDSMNPELNYIYFNEATTKNLKHHGGTGKLTFYKDKNMLKGSYYTNEHRENHGTITLKREI